MEFKKAATLATTHHKIFDRLVLHNVIGLVFFIALFIVFATREFVPGIMSIGAILGHFSFDIYDDLYQLGHIKNWLWPVRFMRK